ncbi:Uncharacterised protein [Chlamydia trachomatis]|nr:Uncharacterised protein [Chlamydia trachomatis]
MNMTLGFISDCFGEKLVRELAHRAEYRWNDNWAEDEFATI